MTQKDDTYNAQKALMTDGISKPEEKDGTQDSRDGGHKDR